MACNCATKEQVEAIYKKYGEKMKTNSSMSVGEKIAFHAKKAGVISVCVLIFPLILAYVLYTVVAKDGKFSLKDFFGLKPMDIEEYVNSKQAVAYV